MRRRSVLLGAALLAAAAIATATWLVAGALDRSRLEARIGAALGSEVALEGASGLVLLPRPALVIDRLSAGDTLAHDVTAELDLGALLGGGVRIRSVRVARLELTLDRSGARPPSLPAPELRIGRGAVRLGSLALPFGEALLVARGPDGPWRLDAEIVREGRRFRATASIGRADAGRPVSVSLAGDDLEANAVGAVGAAEPGGAFAFRGRLTARGRFAEGIEGALTAEARFDRDGALLSGLDALLDRGRFTGSVEASWREALAIDARIATGVLALDDWPGLARLDADPLPGARLRLALSAGVARHGGRILRRVEATVANGADGLALDRLAAALPGGTRLTLDGPLAEGARLALRTRNLRALLLWCGLDPSAIPSGRLRDFEARARLSLAGGGFGPEALARRLKGARLTLEEVEGRLDGAAFQGRLLREAGRLDLALAARGLPLDPYRPALEGLLESGPEGGPPLGSWRLDLAGTRLMDIPVERLELAAEATGPGAVSVSRLALQDAGGLTGEAYGRLDGEEAFLRFSGRTADLARTAELYGVALPGLARRIGAFGFGGRAEGPLDALPLQLDAEAEGWRLRLDGRIADRARFDGRLELAGPPPAWLASAEAEPARLSASVSATRERADFQHLELRHGRMRAHGRGRLTGLADRPAGRLMLRATRLDLPAPTDGLPVWRRRPFDAAPFGAFDLELDLGVEALRIGEERLEDARLDLTLAPEAWSVNEAAAGWRGGRLRFEGGWRAGDGAAEARLEVEDARLPDHARPGPSGARMDASADLAASGRSPYEIVSSLSGRVRLALADGRLNGLDLTAAAAALDGASTEAELLRRLREALASGDSALLTGQVEAALAEGAARSLAGALRLAGGRVGLSGSLDLRRRSIDLAGRLTLDGRPPSPALGFAVAGPLERPARRAEIGALEALLLAEGLAGLLRQSAN